YYIEDYRIEDIAKIIKRTSSAVKMRLQKGRRLLEKVYREEYL
ncbi:MAG: RNA polymerase sigma factor, partial [Clostridia bacterium]|nr:RNA polymerase sigma factor [Clostridia bacterium]